MTLVTIDLGDVAGGHDPDDHVIIRAEAFRESPGGGITSTAEVKIPLVNGVGQAEVEPGPVVVAFRCRAVADTREKRGVVPGEGPVGIEKVLENAFEYLPPVVNQALETIQGAVNAAVDSIKFDKGTPPADANLIDLGVGAWRIISAPQATRLGMPVDRLGTLVITPHSSESLNRYTYLFITNEASSGMQFWAMSTDNVGGFGPWHRQATWDDVQNILADEGAFLGEHVGGDSTQPYALTDNSGKIILGVGAAGATIIPGLPRSGVLYSDVVLEGGQLYRALPQAPDMSRLSGWGSSTMDVLGGYLSGVAASWGASWVHGGKSGELAQHTAARLGSRPPTFSAPFTLASGTHPQEVPVDNLPPSTQFRPTLMRFNQADGSLYSDGVKWFFQRTSVGSSHYVPSTTVPHVYVGDSVKSNPIILNIGKNSFSSTISSRQQLIIDITDEAFGWLAPGIKRAVVMGHFCDVNLPEVSAERDQIMAVRAYQMARYKHLYFDLWGYVTGTEIWVDAGITPTSDDLALQRMGNLPRSLSIDDAHFNDLGYRTVARKMADFIHGLGWY